MLSEKEKILKEFELERYLYLANELTTEKKDFWNKKLESNSELKKMLDEIDTPYKEVLTDTKIDIDEEEFTKIIESVVHQKFISKLKNTFLNILNSENSNIGYKIGFATFILIVGITVSLFDKKSNPINTLSNEMLVWDDSSISNRITKIENALLNRDEQYRQYLKYQLNNDPWKRDISTIEKRIKKIKSDLQSEEL